MPRNILLGVVLGWCVLSVMAHAEDRALIIGIGDAYKSFGLGAIPGPKRDVELAMALAQQLGFAPHQHRVLREEEATKAAIVAGLKWLNDGVKADERAFFFFSGHGTQVPDKDGDEDDGCDEALVPVDGTTDQKRLLDDELHLMLRDLRKRAKVVAFIDACYSGTITKQVYPYPESVVKFDEKRQPQCNKPVNLKSLAVVAEKPATSGAAGQAGEDRLVVVTASAQNEIALGDVTNSGKGSLFTQAISDIVREQGVGLTFEALRDQAAVRIRQASQQVRIQPHTPQLEGNPALFRQDLQWARATPRPEQGDSLAEARNAGAFFDRLIRSRTFHVAFKAQETQIRLGKPIAFSFRSSKAGYLNILELEPNGNVQVLFPNERVSRNQISADKDMRIPADIGGFGFEAREPVGRSRLVAIVTPKPLNLYDQGRGKLVEHFKVLTAADFEALKGEVSRSVGITPPRATREAGEEKEFGATELYLEVVR